MKYFSDPIFENLASFYPPSLPLTFTLADESVGVKYVVMFRGSMKMRRIMLGY